jgi:branched-chain amino acid transport system substrate-binding protein
MLKRILQGVLAGVLCLLPAWAAAQDKPIKVALIASKTGPFEIYAPDTERGLRLGLEYLTQGTMTVLGRKIELIVKDDQFKPELSKAMLAEAYNDDKVDVAIGTSWSGGTLSMLPASEEYKKVLLVEPAIADSITGANWNRYVFRASRNGFQDALATVGLLKDGDNVAFLAADYSYGKEGVASFKEAMGLRKIKAKVVAEEYVPQTATDFTAPMQRIFDAMKPVTGKKYVVVIWERRTRSASSRR